MIAVNGSQRPVRSSRQGVSSQGGFSLIELLIVVTIVGVLLAVALPSYRQFVRESARAEARRVLMEVAADQERFYSLNNSYSTDAGPMSDPVVEDRMSESGRYQVSVTACSGGSIANCFVATATPQGDQASDSCTTLTIDHTGRKGATGDTVDNCWR